MELIKLPYGKDSVSVTIPKQNFIGMMDPEFAVSCADPKKSIENAILQPIGGPKLKDIITPEKTITIIIDDISRPTPISTILPILLSHLLSLGAASENIVIVAALGSHRYMTEEELKERVGAEIYKNYRVINSEFRKPEGLTYVGKTPEGVDVLVTKAVMDTDIHIGIGCLVPHPTMGWAGGGKTVYPGIAGEKVVAYFHLLASLYEGCFYGQDTTPIRDMMEKWVDAVGLHFIINVLLNENAEIVDVVAGHYIKAHREGVRRGKQIVGYKLTEKADIMIASSHPADQDFWQSTKALQAAEAAVKGDRGGIMILLSPNYEGIGPHPEYPKWMGQDDCDEAVRECILGKTVGNPLALAVGNSMSKLRRRRRVIVVSDGVSAEDMRLCGCEHYRVSEFQSLIDSLISENPNCRIGALSNGAKTFLYE
ncbi:MAG: nickel-dependent lactate racemase [Christensenellales bacterium]|jgi:nickel-dependent lactate racemase